MATCKTCGSNFHACSSCMLSYDYEYRYCNEKCWRASEEYKEAKAAFKRLYDSVIEINIEQPVFIFDLEFYTGMFILMEKERLLDTSSFSPFSERYYLGAKIIYKNFYLHWNHYCTHPVTATQIAFIQIFIWMSTLL